MRTVFIEDAQVIRRIVVREEERENGNWFVVKMIVITKTSIKVEKERSMPATDKNFEKIKKQVKTWKDKFQVQM